MNQAPETPTDFLPPSNFAFEPELLFPPPRQLPDSIKQGNYHKKQQRGAAFVVVGAAACLFFAHVPFVQKLGVFFLPLAYLDWISYGLFALAGVWWIRTVLQKGNYRYIKEGVPIVARVDSLQKAPVFRVNGQDSQYAYVASVVLRKPESSELKRFSLESPRFSANRKDRYDTTLRVGQYVTAVYLPGKFEKTLRLYGFLELNPELKFVFDAAENDPRRLGRDVLTASGVAAIVGASMGCCYAIAFFEPVSFGAPTFIWPCLAGGLILGTAFFIHLWRRNRTEKEAVLRRNEAARAEGKAVEPVPSSLLTQTGLRARLRLLLLIPGSVLIGAVMIGCGLLSVNALFDPSRGENRPVQIEGLKETTYDFLFRNYSVEYRWEGSGEKSDFPVMPDKLHTFFAGEELITKGFAEVHTGRLGWPWVKRVYPEGRE